MSSFYCRPLRFVFVHVPRCGGSSITRFFESHYQKWGGLEDLRTGVECDCYRLGRFHMTAETILRKFPELKDIAYFFGFTRNPWGWMASRYHHALARPWHPYHKIAQKGFPPFLEHALEHDSRLLLTYISDGNRILVDDVGRFEMLPDEIQSLSLRLGISLNLEQKNQSNVSTDGYAGIYDRDTRSIVAEVFSKEVETFGYSFNS